jgi:hypothetical protein
MEVLMFTSGKSLSICLFLLVCGLVFGTSLSAQSWESGAPLGDRVRIRLAPGWGLYSMDDINKHYIDRFAKEAGILDDNIDGGPCIYGEVSYSLTPRISTDFGVLYLQGFSEKKSWDNVLVFPGGGRYATRWERSLATTAVAPQMMVKYHFPLGDLDLFSGVGIAWCWGKSILKSDERVPDLGISESIEYRFTAQGFGLLGSVGMSHYLTERWAIGTEIGYRHFVTGDLEDPSGNPWVVDYGGRGHKMNLDFSGAFLLVSLSVRL